MHSDKELSEEEMKLLEGKLFYWFWAEYDLLDFYDKFGEERYMKNIIPLCYGLRVMRDHAP